MKIKYLVMLFVTTLLASNLYAETSAADSDTAAKKTKKAKAEKPVVMRDGEIIKTGYNYGPLPAIAFDADKGFQVGALLNIYDFGDGSTYPNPRQHWYFEASFFTKGSQLFVVSYDNKFSIPGVRFSSSLAITNDKAMDFYGFNGYTSYYDHEAVKVGKDKKSDAPQFTPRYRFKRLALLFKTDFVGNLWNNKLFWEAGYHFSYFNIGDINRDKINKNKADNKKFPAEVPTIYKQYCDWGIIPEKEAYGGFSSSVRLGLMFDTRDKEGAPSRGVWAEAHMMLAPKWLGTTNPYYRYSATFRHYIPIVKNDVLTFAYRLNYEGTIGKSAPWYVLPYITTVGPSYDRDGMGGFRTVRGIMRSRVQGLDMATYNAEFRWRFVKFTLWKQNIAFGLNVFSDGTMVTREYDMSFKRKESDFASVADYTKAKSEYDEYMKMGTGHDRPHITVGGGLRFIMNQNFIVCAEYGLPISKFSKNTKIKNQDGNGAFYLNVGYLF
ncbi:MAG: BamA/TamA family outer membrane protein [Alistipes sp.]|nr:BamA/TamA family outer membrane protein [Alistipes sp.]